MADQPLERTPESAHKRRGCLFWGCLTLAVLFVIIAGVLGFMVYSWVGEYTSATPVPIPKYELRPGEADALKKQLSDFERGKAGAGEPAQLVLTADDLNALIASSPEGERWAGKAFIRLEGDRAFLDTSLPLEDLPFLSGRYLNATVEFTVDLVDGRLTTTVEDVMANGKPLSPQLLTSLKQHDLFENLTDERVVQFARKARRIELKDGKLVLQK